ncbi:MAG: IPTL-CTERM sorting domain-containing protein [Candidatus Contendobacter sp.]|nr:IPTL-CTERM sorting domain-containing protein [Candidatus Contendobacter sp.]MDG4559254.1 IPTL-CTERM sorting domain-containing protein [Candidatus Contendobacter sp.]
MHATFFQSLAASRRQTGPVRALLAAVVALLLGTATVAKAATFTEAGIQLNLDLNTASEAVAIVANASTYTLTLTGGTWSGVDSANVTGNGTATLTVTAAGIAAFDTVSLTDSATGTAATFNNSGVNTYSDTFDITLDNAAGAITFNGNSVFAGTASIAARTSRNISFTVGSTLMAANGNIVLEANQQATPTSGDFIGVNIEGAGVLVTGTGTLSVAGRGGDGAGFQHGVQVRENSSFTVGGNLSGGTTGLLNVSGTGGASTGTSNNGVYVRDTKSQITSTGGPVTITGQGGGTGASSQTTGVALTLGGQISAGNSGTVTVTGTGGAASGLSNMGVGLGSASRITSNGGNVSVTGFGGGLGGGAEHFGVWLTQGAEISAGGAGTVTVEGTGGTDGQVNYGVFVREANSRITSNGGAVSVTGQGGGTGAAANNIGVVLINSGQIGAGGAGTTTVLGTGGTTTGAGNVGVSISTAAQIFSTSGAISVTGAGTATSQALFVGGTSAIASGNNAAITITADSVNLAVNGLVNAGTGTATIQPRTAGTLINLGGADVLNSSPLTLGLTDTELDQITAGTLVLGNATSGALRLSADISRPASTDVQLLAGATIQSSPGISGAFHTGGGSLLIAPGAGGYFRPWRNGTDVTASLLSFNSGSDLFINLDGTVVNTLYAQLNVAGAVDLSGVDLLLPPSSFFPAAGDVFTIVSANSVSGTFNGLANGSTLVFNGRTLQIDYSATTVTLTDVTPAVNKTFTGPTATGTGNATATVTGGGNTCGFVPTPQFVAVASVPAPPPAGYTFPHGLFRFTLANCNPGETVTLTMTYPNPLPPGVQYWKYGPEPPPGDPSNHWYVLPATIAGNTASFSITDGGLGDDDLSANRTIVDQGGPGVPGVGDGATGIPTLHEWALLLLSALFGGLLWRARRRFG